MHKVTNRIICSVILLSLFVAAGCSKSEDMVSYESNLFDTSYIHTVDITLDESDWEAMQANAIAKEDCHGDIVIDGDTLTDVCISTKGSNSLRGVIADSELHRYSLKIKFGKYQKDQTYYGLDVLNLNNNFSDASQMKDFIAYEMFRKMGVAAPLAVYTKVTVNGEYYGLFLAVEEIKYGFLNRNYDGEGRLYKPEPVLLTEINENNGQIVQKAAAGGNEKEDKSERNPFKELSPYTTGADLRYTDDRIESYPDIFENNSIKSDEEDAKRVIAALKHLSEGDANKGVNVDEVIAYFAVHNFTSNYDSYSGLLCHNYYLYEKDGLLSMLPWDYNYYDSLCTEEAVIESEAMADHHVDADVNEPLTVPADSRPMWSWIASDSKYMAQYHSEMDRLLTECIVAGWAENEIARINDMIREEVEADPNAIYTVEAYDNAVTELSRYLKLRTDSVREQLQ